MAPTADCAMCRCPCMCVQAQHHSCLCILAQRSCALATSVASGPSWAVMLRQSDGLTMHVTKVNLLQSQADTRSPYDLQAASQEPTRMKLPSLTRLSALTQLTELTLSDKHNRHSLPGLQHLAALTNLRLAAVPACSSPMSLSGVRTYFAFDCWPSPKALVRYRNLFCT